MRREAKLLRAKAVDSLLLSIEHFNRPFDRGRPEAVLVLLDHAFEMLLKAGIIHKGGRIREKHAPQTIGFDACVRKALTDANVKFLTDQQALTLQSVNGLRDAAQHYLLDLPQQQLYLFTQAGLTLFSDLLKSVFGEKLADHLPERVLPVSTSPPKELTVMLKDEMETIRGYLQPGTRRHVEAKARLRSLAIIEGAVQGVRLQPSDGDLERTLVKIAKGQKPDAVFPGITSLSLSTQGEGIAFNIRFTKKEGIPIHVVAEGTPGAAVVAVKRVAELDYYALGLKDVASKVSLSPPKTTAVVRALKLQADPEYFKEIAIGKIRYGRYSPKAVDRIKADLPNLDMDKIWREHDDRRRSSTQQHAMDVCGRAAR